MIQSHLTKTTSKLKSTASCIPNARMNPLGQTDVFAVSKCSKAGFERTVDHFRADAFALESGSHAWLALIVRAIRPMTWSSLHGILSPWLRLVDWEPER